MIRRSLAAGVILAVTGWTSPGAFSATLDAAPALSVETRWDSNVTNAGGETEGDLVLRATPNATLTLSTPDAAVSLRGGFDAEAYARNTELNDLFSTVFGELRATRPIPATPRLALSPAIRYVQTNDTVRRLLLTQEPIENAPPAEIVLTERTSSIYIVGSLAGSYAIDPRQWISLSTYLSWLNYTGGTDPLEDSWMWGGRLSLTHQMNPRTSMGGFFDTTMNEGEGDADSTEYSAGVAANHQLTPSITIGGEAGVSWIPSESGNQLSPIGRIDANARFQSLSGTLSGSYSLVGVSGFGESIERFDVRLYINGPIAEQWGWTIGGTYQSNLSPERVGFGDTDTVTFGGDAGVAYIPASWINVRLSASWALQRSETAGAPDVDRYAVMIGMNLHHGYRLF